jgi:hypothetical protein
MRKHNRRRISMPLCTAIASNIRPISQSLLAAICCLTLAGAQADRFVYLDQATFLNDLVALGYAPAHESFEDDVVWGSVRTTIVDGAHSAAEITNHGVRWNANFPGGEITTSNGAARIGSWGFYNATHGDPLNGVNDGFVITGESVLYAFGGWFETNTPFAKVDFVIDGDIANPVDFNDPILGTAHQFHGVIDTDGFTTVEVRELEAGGNEAKYIFADDFSFGFAASAPAPLLAFDIINGSQTAGGLASLQASDDDYVQLMSQTSPQGNRAISRTLFIAASPSPTVSRLNATLELGTDHTGVIAAVMLFNFDTSAWVRINTRLLPLADTVYALLDVADPNAYVNDSNGQIRLQLLTLANTTGAPAGYTVRVDQVAFEVTP